MSGPIDWTVLGLELPLAWAVATSPKSPDSEVAQARRRVVQGLEGVLQGMTADPEAGSRSMREAVQALHILVQDEAAHWPESLALALTLTLDRQADLRLRQCLARQDGDWQSQVLRVPVQSSGAEAEAEAMRDEQAGIHTLDGLEDATQSAPTGRQWWSIPVDGLRSGHQLFLLETRELLRGADLALAALRRDPGDYAEQMVLCRAFQAVSVSAQSLGLNRLASWARAGETDFDRLLDDGAQPGVELLEQTEDRLQCLYRELLELTGEPAPPPSMPRAEATGVCVTRVSDGQAPSVEEIAPGLEATGDPADSAEPHPETDGASRLDPVVAPALEAQLDRSGASEPEFMANAENTETPESHEPPEPHEPPAPAQAPWWWAQDWQVWAESPAEDGQVVVDSPMPASIPAAPDAQSMVRIPVHRLQEWAQTLRNSGASGRVADSACEDVAQAIEEARCVPLETASVALFRTARRVAREQGLTLDFDIEVSGIRMDAALVDRLVPILETWIELRVPLSGDRALRLTGASFDGGVALTLGDGAEPPWGLPPRALMDSASVWLSPLGGTVQALAEGWRLTVPVLPHRVPLLPVTSGRQRACLPALWTVGRESVDRQSLLDALTAGQWVLPCGPVPLLRLSALMKSESLPLEDTAFVVHLQRGGESLSLVVDGLGETWLGEPVPMPRDLRGMALRSGLWGLALEGRADVQGVTDPFALLARYGAAARVMSRPRTVTSRSPAST